MFKAVRDIAVGDVVIQAGEVVENPSTRMIDLGLVVEVQDEPKKAEKTEKKEKAEKKEEVKEVKEVKEEAPKEEILTEQTSNVTVEKTEE